MCAAQYPVTHVGAYEPDTTTIYLHKNTGPKEALVRRSFAMN